MQYFSVVGDQATHAIGSRTCPACSEGYPEPCPCGGLIHAEGAGQVDEERDPGVATRCDECGRSQDEVDEALGREPR